jgi:transposase
MSSISITPYFPFCRVHIYGQSVKGEESTILIRPDKRYKPICSVCSSHCAIIHAWVKRPIRDLNCGAVKVVIECRYRKVFCTNCGRILVEDLTFFEPYQRVTKRLARYIYDLCKILTVQDVAEHLGLDWKTVKDIDKTFLEEEYGETDYGNLTILAVDEIAIRKGHRYMTVVLDYLTGRVVWMGEGRGADTLMEFFEGMTDEQIEKLEAIAMDMWDPYIKAVETKAPHVKIVFDLFHMVKEFNKVIDRVRIDEYKKASETDKRVIQGSKYLLLKNPENIKKDEEKEHLDRLLALNETISKVMILKDKLKLIWECEAREESQRQIDEWCALAESVHHPSVDAFVRRIRRYDYGILNHCEYPIHTSMLEGVNNKIKVIKRKAYGFLDNRYFSLKIIQAFSIICN